jgi:thiamine-phosphate pyrophosphorylase
MVAARLARVNDLQDARLYLVCDARPRDFLRRALAGGVDVIQLRDRSLDDDGIVRAAEEFRAAADEFGAPFILNDRPDLVEASGADGVHLGQEDRLERAGRILGRSTHVPEQALAEWEADYLSIGPVWETPTKPGRPAAGLDYVRWAAEHVTDRPWFAIGGIDARNVREVVGAGARRIVVVRAITEAADPEAAAKELADGLA